MDTLIAFLDSIAQTAFRRRATMTEQARKGALRREGPSRGRSGASRPGRRVHNTQFDRGFSLHGLRLLGSFTWLGCAVRAEHRKSRCPRAVSPQTSTLLESPHPRRAPTRPGTRIACAWTKSVRQRRDSSLPGSALHDPVTLPKRPRESCARTGRYFSRWLPAGPRAALVVYACGVQSSASFECSDQL